MSGSVLFTDDVFEILLHDEALVAELMFTESP
jgi:hypothetical protein